MSPAVEDFLSQPSSSSTQRTHFQNPNPSVQKYSTDSGMFNDGFNLMNSSKLNCSNDVAAAAATVRSSSRKHVKAKKLSSCSDAASTKSVNSTASTIDFVFNATTSGSELNSSLGHTGSGGNGEQQSAGEFLDFSLLRFNMGATNNSKLAKKMDSEEAQNNGNKFQDGGLKFVFGADEKADSRKVSERGANKFGKLNGVDFVFGANMNNGVMNSNSSNVGHAYRPGETVGGSGIDGFMKVNRNTTKADSDLVNSMSGLNLGTRGPGEVRSFMDDNPKAEEKNTSDSRKFENVDFVFSADFVTDSNFKKAESSFKGNRKINDEMDNLKSQSTGSCDYLKKCDNNIDSVPDCNIGFVFGSNLGNAFGDNRLSKVANEMKTSNIHDPSKVSGMDKINDSVGDSCSCSNNLFVFGIDKRDTSCGRSDTSLNQCKGANLAGFCIGKAAKKTDEVNKAPAFEEKGKSDMVTKVYSFNKPEISTGSDGGVPNEPVNQKEKSSDGGHCYSNQLKTEAESIKDTFPSASSSSTTGLGFVPKAHYSEAPLTSGAGITNNFSFASKVGGFGTSFKCFKTPDLNVASSFTSDMFPGLGKKLEFNKSNSVSQRKLKKTKGKLRQQDRSYQRGGFTHLSKDVPESFEESPGCSSPMDFSPYSATDCAPTSTDPPTSQVKNEDVVDTTEKLSAKNNSSSANVDAPVRQRPHQKKYKMKTGCGLEFTTPNSRADASLAHEPTSREHTKATDQESCDKWRKRGNQAYKNGELSEAEICYSKGINSIQHAETPGFCIEPLLLCYSNRAATRMALGRMREGLKDCRMAAALDPKFMKANLRSANCHLLLGEVDDAFYNYNKCLESVDNVCLDRRIAIEAADGLQKAQKVADYLKLSAELLEQKTYDSATNALRIIADALSISCYSEKLLHMKGEALLVLGKHEEVVQQCEQTLGLAEKNFATGGVVGHMNVDGYDCKLWRWNLMSKSYFHLGRLEIALDLIEKHTQLRSTTDKIVGPEESLTSLAVTIGELLHCKNAGNEAFQNSKYAEAVEHYTAAISKSIESRSFAAVCFCNRAAAHQSLGGIVDAIGDCSIAIALDGSYPKALSRRATLQEMIRDYKHAADDLQRLISILEIQSGKNSQKSATPGSATGGSVKDLRRARRRLSSIEEKAKKERSLDLYLILGIKPSDASSEVKKAYRKAALRHHPDKAGQILARAESGSDGQQWKVIAESIQRDADRLFKMIGEAYAVLSDFTKRSKYDLEEEMWEEMNINVGSSSSSRRASDFYNSPYETANRRSSQESRKTYSNSHYYYWQDPEKTYHSSYPRW
ncbi:hypothetical protein L6452_03861 [Arctium lappa]|uniref:Uncharacterized protein n=1 Tax=Arctium lappa TaxID=4217 RepID=A0ACB9FPB7_ARCLA|nr:hypothetical protein L6452_03861 [Arctium lappa]